MHSRGIVYCSTGPNLDSTFNLCFSILSLRRYWNGPVTILTSHALEDLQAFASQLNVDLQAVETKCDTTRYESRYLKTTLGRLTPYQQTLYLDSDTIIKKTVGNLFNHSFAMALDARPTIGQAADFLRSLGEIDDAEVTSTLAACGGDFPHYNSGVIAWEQNEQSQKLFDAWHAEWQLYNGRDQAALARAIARIKPQITTLDQKFNHFGELGGVLESTGAVVWHGCCAMEKHQRLYPQLYAACQQYLPEKFQRKSSAFESVRAMFKRVRYKISA